MNQQPDMVLETGKCHLRSDLRIGDDNLLLLLGIKGYVCCAVEHHINILQRLAQFQRIIQRHFATLYLVGELCCLLLLQTLFQLAATTARAHE